MNRKTKLKKLWPFTDCISKISNMQVGNAKYLGAVKLMYNLIE